MSVSEVCWRVFSTQMIRRAAVGIRAHHPDAARELHEYLVYWKMGELFYEMIGPLSDRSLSRDKAWARAVNGAVKRAMDRAHELRAEGLIDG
jgi:hypothetical protein